MRSPAKPAKPGAHPPAGRRPRLRRGALPALGVGALVLLQVFGSTRRLAAPSLFADDAAPPPAWVPPPARHNASSATSDPPAAVESASASACPPSRPASCLGPWAGRADVPADWWAYLTSVYGPGGVAFPFDPAALTFFYRDRVPFRDAAEVVPFRKRKKVPFGKLYECGWADADAGGDAGFWCVHAYGSRGPGGWRDLDAGDGAAASAGGGPAPNRTASYLARFGRPLGGPAAGRWQARARGDGHDFVAPAFRAGQRVEVSHECCDDFKDSEVRGGPRFDAARL